MLPEVRRLTPADQHFIHGYYVLQPWDEDEQLFLCQRLPFGDRLPRASDAATVGVIDRDDGSFTPLGASTAWNYKLGTMPHWVPGRKRTILYNTYEGDAYRARMTRVDDGSSELVDHPVFTVSRDGKYGYGHDYGRVHALRPGYGYGSHGGVASLDIAPPGDGLVRVSLETGSADLIVSYAELASYCTTEPTTPLLIGRSLTNWSSTRVLISFRYHDPGTDTWPTAIVTMDPTGGDRHLLVDFDNVPKHFDWFDDERLFIWATYPDTGRGWHLVTDRTDQHEPIARGSLEVDGHVSRLVGGGPMLTDTFPDAERRQHLFLYGPASDQVVKLGSWDSPWMGSMDLRCDLDPSWSPTGRLVTFNSIHEGFRACYVTDVGDTVRDLD
jgi:hypothetical protein